MHGLLSYHSVLFCVIQLIEEYPSEMIVSRPGEVSFENGIKMYRQLLMKIGSQNAVESLTARSYTGVSVTAIEFQGPPDRLMYDE